MSRIPTEANGVADLSIEEVTSLARKNGMHLIGSRPPFGKYLKQLWRRRALIWTLAAARSYARNEGQKYGQAWAIINPLLLIATYLFIFGFLLKTSSGIDNFVGFLSIGVILFTFTAATLTSGSRAIRNNTGLIRALHFPRAMLPLAAVMTEFVSLLPAVAVLLIVLPFTGETPTWSWLLFLVALPLQALMQTGFVLILARIVNASTDTWNMIVVAVRVLRYLSGVFFSISHVTANHPVIGLILDLQPFALQLSLARQALMSQYELSLMPWLVGIGWAIILPAVGLWIFWFDEAKYGRG